MIRVENPQIFKNPNILAPSRVTKAVRTNRMASRVHDVKGPGIISMLKDDTTNFDKRFGES